MKIVYFTNAIIDSSAANAVNIACMCEAFQSLGHQVTLIARSKDPSTFSETVYFQNFDITSQFRVIPIFDGKVPFLRTFLFFYNGMRAARRLKPALVYSRFWIDFAAVLMFPVKLVIERHSPAFKNPIVRKIQAKLYQSARVLAIVTITDPLRKLLSEALPHVTNKILVLSDGARVRSDLSAGKPVTLDLFEVNVGYTGHLYAGRGIEVIAELARVNPMIGFHIIGGNESDVDRWKKQASRLSNLIFYGHVSHADGLASARKMDVLLAPYQDITTVSGIGNTSGWMSPLKIFEYMSHKVPFICSNIPVIREVLEDGRNCLLVSCADVNAWNNALQRLLVNRNMAKMIADNAYADLSINYCWNTRAMKILAAIDI